LYKMQEMFKESTGVADYARRYCTHMAAVLAALDVEAVGRAIEAMQRTSENGKTLFFIANGGSAATASHFVNDLVAGSYVEGAPKLRAYCLSDNAATVTALGNDAGYDNIFSHQLRVDMVPGDLVYAMSVSGNSENIIRAVEYARANGGTTVGISGFDGGRLAKAVDISVLIPSTKDEYGPVEDVFNVLDHIIISYIAMSRGRWLHH